MTPAQVEGGCVCDDEDTSPPTNITHASGYNASQQLVPLPVVCSPMPFLLLPLHASGTQPFIWGLLKIVLQA
jgi:hypothetical protein